MVVGDLQDGDGQGVGTSAAPTPRHLNVVLARLLNFPYSPGTKRFQVRFVGVKQINPCVVQVARYAYLIEFAAFGFKHEEVRVTNVVQYSRNIGSHSYRGGVVYVIAMVV